MKICILISQLYSENMLVPTEVEGYTYLNKLGFEIHWVAITSSNSKKVIRNETVVHLIRYPFGSRSNNLLIKILREIVYTIYRGFMVYNLCKKEKYNALIIRDNIFDSITATILRKKINFKCIFQLSNPLGQEWEAYKIEKKKPLVLFYLIAGFKRRMYRLLFKRTDLILATSKWAAEDFISNGASIKQVMVSPTGISRQRFETLTPSNIKMIKPKGKRVIIYVGVVAKSRKLEVLIEAFKRLLSIRDDVILLIVGTGNAFEDLKVLVQTLGLSENVVFTGEVKQNEVPYYLNMADVTVCPIPPFSFYKMSSPAKLFEYMAMGKPVVANVEIPEHKEVIEQSGGGLLVQYTPDAFARGILTLLNDEQMARELGNKGRNWVLCNRTYDILAVKLKERLQTLIQNEDAT